MLSRPVSEKLGSGSYFEIFATENAGSPLALKRPKPHLQEDPRVRRMIDTEAKVLEAVADSDHFPRLFGRGESEAGPYLLLERLEGLNLDQALSLEGAGLAPAVAAGIVFEIAQGLRSLHSASVAGLGSPAHGDLKPHNVMVLRDGRVKIIDLGLEGGTFAYMPPERMDSKKVEPATDLFALGLILYELLAGKPLVDGEKKMDVYFQMKDLRRQPPVFPSFVPAALAGWIDRSLKAGTEGGYRDADAQCQDLADFLGASNPKAGAGQRSEWIRRLETKSHERNP